MATVEATKQITPEELLALPDSKQFELVNGELVERHMGWNSGWNGAQILYFLTQYERSSHLGRATNPEGGYRCYPDDPLKVRKPDASFIRNERLPADDELDGWCRVAPNVAVEVVSPNDLDLEVDEKVAEYLAAGVELVWVIRPPRRTVRVHRADGSVTNLHLGEFLEGENVLPGFRVAVAELFK